MIGKITGRVDYCSEDHVLIDVQGVGYVVYCSKPTLAMMPGPGGVVALYTEMLVRDDNLQLFGFPTLAEREWHRLLTTVQGVGSKAALAIAGTLGVDGIARALSLGDANAIKAAPGVGPKLAQRIIVELRDKAPAIMSLGAMGARKAAVDDDVVLDAATAARPVPEDLSLSQGNAEARADALSALVNLGYAQGEAAAAINETSVGSDGIDTQSLIRACLRLLAPKG